jgi:hypothetical protein
LVAIGGSPGRIAAPSGAGNRPTPLGSGPGRAANKSDYPIRERRVQGRTVVEVAPIWIAPLAHRSLPQNERDFWRRKRTRQPAARMRPRSPEQDARVTAPSAGCMFAAPPHSSSGLGVRDGLQRTVRLNRCRGRGLIIRTDCRVARVGPTTPKRATARASKRPPGSVPRLAHVGQQCWM